MAYSKTHAAFVKTMRTHAKAAVTALQQAQNDALAYGLLGYAPSGDDPITQDDLTPAGVGDDTNNDLVVADINNAIAALSGFVAVASASNSAALAALLKLAR